MYALAYRTPSITFERISENHVCFQYNYTHYQFIKNLFVVLLSLVHLVLLRVFGISMRTNLSFDNWVIAPWINNLYLTQFHTIQLMFFSNSCDIIIIHKIIKTEHQFHLYLNPFPYSIQFFLFFFFFFFLIGVIYPALSDGW